MVSAPKILRGVEVGTRAGYLALAGIVVYFLYRTFAKKAVTETPVLPPIGPVKPSDPPPVPTAGGSDTGIVVGPLVSAVRARILVPADGARVYRPLFKSTFPAQIELVNDDTQAHTAQLEIVADFAELAGGERNGVRTMLGNFQVDARSSKRLSVEIESDNTNSGAYEFGQANATLAVFTNGKQTQATTAEVW